MRPIINWEERMNPKDDFWDEIIKKYEDKLERMRLRKFELCENIKQLQLQFPFLSSVTIINNDCNCKIFSRIIDGKPTVTKSDTTKSNSGCITDIKNIRKSFRIKTSNVICDCTSYSQTPTKEPFNKEVANKAKDNEKQNVCVCATRNLKVRKLIDRATSASENLFCSTTCHCSKRAPCPKTSHAFSSQQSNISENYVCYSSTTFPENCKSPKHAQCCICFNVSTKNNMCINCDKKFDQSYYYQRGKGGIMCLRRPRSKSEGSLPCTSRYLLCSSQTKLKDCHCPQGIKFPIKTISDRNSWYRCCRPCKEKKCGLKSRICKVCPTTQSIPSKIASTVTSGKICAYCCLHSCKGKVPAEVACSALKICQEYVRTSQSHIYSSGKVVDIGHNNLKLGDVSKKCDIFTTSKSQYPRVESNISQFIAIHQPNTSEFPSKKTMTGTSGNVSSNCCYHTCAGIESSKRYGNKLEICEFCSSPQPPAEEFSNKKLALSDSPTKVIISGKISSYCCFHTCDGTENGRRAKTELKTFEACTCLPTKAEKLQSTNAIDSFPTKMVNGKISSYCCYHTCAGLDPGKIYGNEPKICRVCASIQLTERELLNEKPLTDKIHTLCKQVYKTNITPQTRNRCTPSNNISGKFSSYCSYHKRFQKELDMRTDDESKICEICIPSRSKAEKLQNKNLTDGKECLDCLQFCKACVVAKPVSIDSSSKVNTSGDISSYCCYHTCAATKPDKKCGIQSRICQVCAPVQSLPEELSNKKFTSNEIYCDCLQICKAFTDIEQKRRYSASKALINGKISSYGCYHTCAGTKFDKRTRDEPKICEECLLSQSKSEFPNKDLINDKISLNSLEVCEPCTVAKPASIDSPSEINVTGEISSYCCYHTCAGTEPHKRYGIESRKCYACALVQPIPEEVSNKKVTCNEIDCDIQQKSKYSSSKLLCIGENPSYCCYHTCAGTELDKRTRDETKICEECVPSQSKAEKFPNRDLIKDKISLDSLEVCEACTVAKPACIDSPSKVNVSDEISSYCYHRCAGTESHKRYEIESRKCHACAPVQPIPEEISNKKVTSNEISYNCLQICKDNTDIQQKSKYSVSKPLISGKISSCCCYHTCAETEHVKRRRNESKICEDCLPSQSNPEKVPNKDLTHG